MADERLGATFTIDVSQLTAGLRQANRLIRESESEFKAAAAGMDNWTKSEDGLNSRIRTLTNVMEIQKEKVRALKAEYNRLINEGMSPTSQQAVQLRTKINNEEAALNKTEKEIRKNKQALSELGTQTKKTGDEIESSKSKFEGFGGVAKKAGQVAAAAFAAAVAAVAALGKASIESYAQYEQLVGGIDTLFKDSSGLVQEYAQNAYKTAGLSANQYMEQATSFAGSLLQSLGGDTEKAARYADRAIIDMSDNANKMGTDITMIQNAYQGFAKQNYTMLDNLKLGYGGTKTEMERLLADATKLSGVKYDISSYADIVDAIHVVQENLGITGTTAKEASETIQGSIFSLKAAWQNLLTGLADKNANLSGLIDNLVDSAKTAFSNLIPVIKQFSVGLIQMVRELAPEIPKVIKEIIPEVFNAAVGLMQGVVDIIPMLVSTIVEIVPQMADVLIDSLPQLTSSLIDGAMEIINGVAELLPILVEKVMQIVPVLVSSISGSLPKILEAVFKLVNSVINALPKIAMGIVEALPQIITALVDGLINSIPVILNGSINALMAIIDAIPYIIEALILNLPQITMTIVSTLLEHIPQLLEMSVRLFMTLIEAIPHIIAKLAQNIPEIIQAIVSGLLQGMSRVADAGRNLMASLWSGLGDAWSVAWNWGADFMRGLYQGIVDWAHLVIDGVSNIATKISEFLHFSRPDKGDLRNYEQWMPHFMQGLTRTLKQSSPKLLNEVDNLSQKLSDKLGINLNGGIAPNLTNLNAGISGSLSSQGYNVGGSVVVNQVNNYSQAHSRYELYKSKKQTAAAVRLAMGSVNG